MVEPLNIKNFYKIMQRAAFYLNLGILLYFLTAIAILLASLPTLIRRIFASLTEIIANNVAPSKVLIVCLKNLLQRIFRNYR